MLINVLEAREQHCQRRRQGGGPLQGRGAQLEGPLARCWWLGRYSTPGKKFNGDFFLLRLVTSVLFLHSYVPNLSPTSISILHHTYFSTSLALDITRGRPALPIRNFYASTANPPAPCARPHAYTTRRCALCGPDNERMVPDPAELAHNDDHLTMLQRSLAHFASLYGATPAGLADATNGDRDPRARTQREDGEDLGDAL